MNTNRSSYRSPRSSKAEATEHDDVKLTGHAKTQATLSWLDSLPYYVSQLALRLPRTHGIILLHLWHVTAGNHKPNAIVPHSALEALVGNKRYEDALSDLQKWGVIKRQKVLYKGRTTWCYAVEIAYAKWNVPTEYTAALDPIVEQGIWRAASVETADLSTDEVSWDTYSGRIKAALMPQQNRGLPADYDGIQWDSPPIGVRPECEGTPVCSQSSLGTTSSPRPGGEEDGDVAPSPGGGLPPTGTGDSPLPGRGEEGQQTQQAQRLKGSPNVHCSNVQRDQAGATDPPLDLEASSRHTPDPSPEGRASGAGPTASDMPMPPPIGGAAGRTPKALDPVGSRPTGARDLSGAWATDFSNEEILAARLQLWLTNGKAWYRDDPEASRNIRSDIACYGKAVCKQTGMSWKSIVERMNDTENPPFLYNRDDTILNCVWRRMSDGFDVKLNLLTSQMVARLESDMRERYQKIGLQPPKLADTRVRFPED